MEYIKINVVDNSLSQDEQLELCKQLRIQTGYGLMDCKKALTESNYNFKTAIKWLSEFRKRPYILY